ncbi:MAG: response regulator [Granulosicoccaceae bacterium]
MTISSTRPSSKKTIVLVEDEAALRENYRLALEKAGYDVHDFSQSDTAIKHVTARMPDLAIIDIGLGNDPEAGFDLCQNLRALSAKLPILFLTARDSELDVISGLRLGADDYLTKDISLAHLIVRVNTLLRRVEAMSGPDTQQEQQIGKLSLDQNRLHLDWQGETVDLTVTEFWLINCLVSNPGQVKSRQQLMSAANVVLDDQTITAHVKRIRKKFLALDNQFDAIQTVYGLGYRWVTDV